MSCESCTGCFEAAPCSAPSPSLHGHISKEYRHFLKAARVCRDLLVPRDMDTAERQEDSSSNKSKKNVDHGFNTLIGILANNQFTAQTYLTLAYKQLGPSVFLQMSRRLAHHGFWGRLLTWAFLYVEEDSERLLRMLVDHPEEDEENQGKEGGGERRVLVQRVNDEAEMFEVFNPAVRCQRVQWNLDPLPSLSFP